MVTVWDLEIEENRLAQELERAREAAETLPDLEKKLAVVRDRLTKLKARTHYDDPLDGAVAAEA